MGEESNQARELDPRWVTEDLPTVSRRGLEAAVARTWPSLGKATIERLYSSGHDVVELLGSTGHYALKCYRPGVRSEERLQWEVELHHHLFLHEAPVMPLVEGRSGYLETLQVDGQQRHAVLSHWAPGTKPRPSETTYHLLGRAAGLIHRAADSFRSAHTPVRDLETELDAYLVLLRPALEAAGRLDRVSELAERVRGRLSNPSLSRGICHNDLTLDNVHVDGEDLFVFDLDYAGEHWRASEPQGVFHYAQITGRPWWDCWKAGYRTIQSFADADERAVGWFVPLFQFENLAWKLGLTPTSVGVTMSPRGVPGIVDDWVRWVNTHCTAP